MYIRLTDPAAAAPLFDGWEDTMIWSCLQGVMGAVWADEAAAPRTAVARLGDFAFLAGRPDAALLREPCWRRGSFAILAARGPGWEQAIAETFGPRARPVTRYALRKEPDAFDRAALGRMARALPAGCTLHPLDGSLYHACLAEDWSRDLVSNYRDEAEYRRLGLGVVALRQGRPVAGASAYSRYRTGIEIEIDTRADCRRQGLAAACGASLILACLERGLYPSWDAQNPASLALAQKLGYRPAGPYTAYETDLT